MSDDLFDLTPDKPKPSELSAWLDRELTQDIGAAMNKDALDICWDAYCTDKSEWLRVGAVLRKHKVYTEVVKVIEIREKSLLEAREKKNGQNRRNVQRVPIDTPPAVGSIGDIGDGEIDFRVSRMVVYASDPPTYKLEIDGSKWVILTTKQLLSRRMFEERFFEIIGRSPALPEGKGAVGQWKGIVNRWRAAAEVIEQPEEVSEFGLLRDELRYVLDGLAVSEDPEDIDRKAVLMVDGVVAARFITIKNALTAKGIAAPSVDLARALRELDVERAKDSERISGARFWRWKIPSIRAREKQGTDVS